DGHTNFTIPATQDRIDYLNNGGLTLPLRLKIVENKILVDFPLISCSIQENDEIICMNNINSQTILSQLYLLLGAEKGNAIKENQLTSYLSTLLWYKYNWGEKYDFTIKRGKKIWKESLDGISQIDAFPVLKARLGKSLPQFVYTLSPDKQTATLQIMNLYQLPQLKQFCDSVFSVINREHVPNLVIDVRNNKGGSSAGVDMLLSYLSHDAYTLYIKTDLKISSYSKRYNEQKHPETYEEIKNLPDGSLFAIRDSFVEGNRDKADIYKGSVTVLVNESTYSGASTFASAIKKSHAGKVLGETGCPTVYFGNYMSFTLPNSRLEYYISLNKFYE
ncbi:peptidase S41 family protein, partial [Bacteroides fragilis str. 3988 T1]